MLSHALLALLVIVIVLLGGSTMLLVATGALDPLLVTIVSLGVTVVGGGALATLLVRRQRQRVRRELHTIRRSQMQRDRQPERYGTLAESTQADETAGEGQASTSLARDLPRDTGSAAPRGLPPASTIETALDAGLMVLMLEPVIEMPRNAAVAFRARPALPGSDTPLAEAAIDRLPPTSRTKLELWAMGTALEAAEEKLRLPVQCDVSRALLGSTEDGIGLRAILEDFPPRLLILRAPTGDLDALEAGRLTDAIEAGASVVLTDAEGKALLPTTSTDLVARDISQIAVEADSVQRVIGLARTVSSLRDGGVALQADAVATPEQGADLAALGFTLFTGKPFGEPRTLADTSRTYAEPVEPVEAGD